MGIVVQNRSITISGNVGVNIPQFITNGLIIQLDAANRDSYTASSPTWRDLSGNNNHLTFEGTPTFDPDYSGSLLFGGGEGGYTPAIAWSTFSLGFWYKIFFFGTPQYVCACPGSGNVIVTESGLWNQWSIGTNNVQGGSTYGGTGGSMTFGTFGGAPFSYNGTRFNMDFDGTSPPGDSGFVTDQFRILGQWTYFGVTYRNNTSQTTSTYRNGIKQDTVTVNATINPNTPLKLFGSQPHCGACRGRGFVSMLHVYNRDLSDDEHFMNYQATKSRFGL
jgi:hypothetical protein